MKVDLSYFLKMEVFNDKDEPAFVDETGLTECYASCLSALRQIHNYSLKTVSEATEIPFQSIHRYEKGENTPSIIQALKLSYFYKMPLHEMFFFGMLIQNGTIDKEALKEYYQDE